MKILIIHSSFKVHGGAERIIVRLGNFLVKSGHRVDICSREFNQQFSEDIDKKIVEIASLKEEIEREEGPNEDQS